MAENSAETAPVNEVDMDNFYGTNSNAADEPVDAEKVKNEYKRFKMPFFITLDEIEERYGIGNRIYFSFMKFIILANIVLFILGLINFLCYVASGDSTKSVMCNYPSMNIEYTVGCNDSILKYIPGIDVSTSAVRNLRFYEKFFVSAYGPDQKVMWYVLTIASVACWFILPFVYFIVMRTRHGTSSSTDNVFRLNGQDDEIPENSRNYTKTNRLLRSALSWVIFVAFLAVSAVVIYFVQKAGAQDDTKDNFWISIVVTVVIVLINTVWGPICGVLVTELEKHTRWSSVRKITIVKLYVFKIVNVIVSYAALRYAFVKEYACPLQDTGYKFFLLMIVDLFLSSAIEFVSPYALQLAKKRIKFLRTRGSDISEMPEFNVAEEFLEVLYRLFITYIGTASMPMITFFSLITNIIEYPLDKLRMTKFSQEPRPLDSNFNGFIALFMFISAVAGFVAFPTGAVFTLIHFGIGDDCAMWATDPKSLP